MVWELLLCKTVWNHARRQWKYITLTEACCPAINSLHADLWIACKFCFYDDRFWGQQPINRCQFGSKATLLFIVGGQSLWVWGTIWSVAYNCLQCVVGFRQPITSFKVSQSLMRKGNQFNSANQLLSRPLELHRSHWKSTHTCPPPRPRPSLPKGFF